MLARLENPVFRVDHFQANRTRADIAKTTKHDACSKLRLLLPRKMKKPERHLARTVTNTDEQISSTAIYGFRKQDFAADETAATCLQRTDFGQGRAVFVAVRQQEQQVFHAAQTEASKFRVECRADARENG